MGDVVGRLFREFALTLAVTILISAAVSLTLVPMALRQAAAPPAETKRKQIRSAGTARNFDALIHHYGRGLNWVLDRQPLTLAGRGGDAGADRLPLYRHSQGLFPGPGHRALQGISQAAANGFLRRHGAAPAGAGRGHPQGPRCRKPVLLHRRRRHQHHAQQRPVPDQSEAARRPQRATRHRSSRDLERETASMSPASRFTCSRCRI